MEQLTASLSQFLSTFSLDAVPPELYAAVAVPLYALLLFLRRNRKTVPSVTSAPAPQPQRAPAPAAPPLEPIQSEAPQEIPAAAPAEPAPVQPPPAAVIPPPPGRKVSEGLSKSRSGFLGRLRNLFQQSTQESFSSQLEELLITSDLGVQTTAEILKRVQSNEGVSSEEGLRDLLKSELRSILSSPQDPRILADTAQPFVILIVGVNGVGKTTTIGKLAKLFSDSGRSVILAAGDTFRAAAGSQIGIWAERSNVKLIQGDEGAKPSTVVYTAIQEAKNSAADILIIDTAGRLHTRVNLMNELKSVAALIARELPGAPHETILVVDATTGQNALQQAKEFNSAAPLTGIVITKLDGTAKGGIVVAIKRETGVPIRYIGIGEGIADLKPFSASEFVDALLEPTDGDNEAPMQLFAETPVVDQAPNGMPVARRRANRSKSAA